MFFHRLLSKPSLFQSIKVAFVGALNAAEALHHANKRKLDPTLPPLCVGESVDVFWDGEDEFFSARVTGIRPHKRGDTEDDAAVDDSTIGDDSDACSDHGNYADDQCQKNVPSLSTQFWISGSWDYIAILVASIIA